MNISTLMPECIFYGYVLALDQLSVASTASYSLRKLRGAYTGSAICVRRSIDNAEQDIGFVIAPQTRTNLASIPVNNDGGTTTSGLTMTTLGTGTEFGQPYIDVRLQGTATVAGFPQFQHSPSGAFNPTIHAPLTDGLVYTASMGARLIAGTVPAGGFGFRALCRTTAGAFSVGPQLNSVPAPTSALQRYAVSFVPSGGTAYCQVNLFTAVALLEVVDFTLRLYSANVEQGVGNLRPLLQRNTSEVVANVGDLDVEKMATFVGGENLLLRSEEFDNAVWTIGGASVVANSTIAPTGALTCDVITENAVASTQHRFNRSTSLTASIPVTLSVYVKRVVGTRQFQLGISGGSLVAKAYFDLATGTVGYTQQCTASISAEKEGFYRVSLTATPDTTVSHSMFWAMTDATTNGSETYNGDGISSIAIWGSQLNQGQLYDYNPTTSTAIPLTAAYNGFIPIWYDQSGSARDMTQTTAGNQFLSLVTGAVVTESNKPSVIVPTVAFAQNDFGAMPQPYTRSYVLTREDTLGVGSAGHYISNFNSTPNVTEYAVNSTTMNQYATGTPNAQTVQNLALNETAIFTSIYNSAVGSSLAKNGTNLVAPAGAGGGTGGLSGVRVGAINGAPATTGRFGISELIIFASALSTTDRQALERNQGQYYGITVA